MKWSVCFPLSRILCCGGLYATTFQGEKDKPISNFISIKYMVMNQSLFCHIAILTDGIYMIDHVASNAMKHESYLWYWYNVLAD